MKSWVCELWLSLWDLLPDFGQTHTPHCPTCQHQMQNEEKDGKYICTDNNCNVNYNFKIKYNQINIALGTTL